jgi:galactitol-specific phosphotransferase system IIB component
MKILTICSHGNTRSVALAYILKTLFKQEAIAIGAEEISGETGKMLYEWADKVVYLDKEVLPKFWYGGGKITMFNVGKDVWFNPKHQELVHKLYRELSKHPELWKK